MFLDEGNIEWMAKEWWIATRTFQNIHVSFSKYLISKWWFTENVVWSLVLIELKTREQFSRNQFVGRRPCWLLVPGRACWQDCDQESHVRDWEMRDRGEGRDPQIRRQIQVFKPNINIYTRHCEESILCWSPAASLLSGPLTYLCYCQVTVIMNLKFDLKCVTE